MMGNPTNYRETPCPPPFFFDVDRELSNAALSANPESESDARTSQEDEGPGEGELEFF